MARRVVQLARSVGQQRHSSHTLAVVDHTELGCNRVVRATSVAHARCVVCVEPVVRPHVWLLAMMMSLVLLWWWWSSSLGLTVFQLPSQLPLMQLLPC